MNKLEAMRKALLKISGGLSSAYGDADFDLPQGIQECFDALDDLDKEMPGWNELNEENREKRRWPV